MRALAPRLAACKRDGRLELGADCQAAIRTVLDGCTTADLELLATTQAVGEACKDTLRELLPHALDSVRSRVVVLGRTATGDVIDLYVAVANVSGEPAAHADLQVRLEIAGRLELAQAMDLTPLPERCEAPVFAASTILDYSGSMSDRDVDESIAIMEVLHDAIPERCMASDVLLFSERVRRRSERTADRAAVKRALVRDDAMPRTVTALFDALGDAIRGLASERAPIKLAIVATDGQENASQRWQYEPLVRTARAGNVRVISFGSLLSDIDVLEQLGAATGGFFVYRPRMDTLAAAAHTAARLLSSTRRVRITDARLSIATHVVLDTPDGTSVRVALR
jgi:hypothetical protein